MELSQRDNITCFFNLVAKYPSVATTDNTIMLSEKTECVQMDTLKVYNKWVK